MARRKRKTSASSRAASDESRDNDNEKMLDYGMAADAYAGDEESSHDDDASSQNNDHEKSNNNDDDDDDSDDIHQNIAMEDGEEESGEEEEEDSSSEEETSSDEHRDDDDDVDDDDDDDDDEEEEEEEQQHVENISANAGPEGCSFDVRNLIAINSHQISAAHLYQKKKKSKRKKMQQEEEEDDEENLTIPSTEFSSLVVVDEELLLEKASDGCAQLLGALWELPNERSDAGLKAILPSYFEIKTPRALPPPPPKKETKWEQFAKERGIPLNKKKREAKVWDEATGTWMYRHGYKKAIHGSGSKNNADGSSASLDWPIMEVKGNQDPYADPWEALRDAKRKRVEKNVENRMRNQERAGALTKGTTTRIMKDKKKVREDGRRGGSKGVKDASVVIPSGVPVDLRDQQEGQPPTVMKKRGMEKTKAALVATQRSTASLGKFDAMREGEPERKATVSRKKRKFTSGTSRKVIETEADRGMKVLEKVIAGGGAKGEKARRKGSLAKGETAYDYEYDDGLGPSTFRKKKGRAAMGKMRKMTKKRVT